ECVLEGIQKVPLYQDHFPHRGYPHPRAGTNRGFEHPGRGHQALRGRYHPDRAIGVQQAHHPTQKAF
ncbi:MAG: hypothetical protein KDE06_11570, partial [Rhodobacteraceae bacterium]|nr:hypothetical protein [Paracoccaceae bacterium]